MKIRIILLFIAFIVLLQFYVFNDRSWKAWSLPLAGKIIVIDPGHGGPDGGAIGGDIIEKDIALLVSFRLRDYLQQQGAFVKMTREGDYDLADEQTRGYSRRKVEDLQRRVHFINRSEADVFISIHLNAIPSPKWRGAQSFYYRSFAENERLAKFIQDEMRKNLENTNRFAKPIQTVYLLKAAEKPGVLVEIGFLSNEQERLLLATPAYQEKVAASIYRGVLRYFSNEPSPSE